MTPEEEAAVARAASLLGPGATSLIANPLFKWDALLPLALTVDEDGRPPGTTGYVETHDPYWLAGLAASQFSLWQAGTGSTKKLLVDGDSIEAEAADWGSVAWDLFRQSPLWRLTNQGEIRVPSNLSHFRPTSLQV